MQWLVTLRNGENFVVYAQDEEDAGAKACAARDDHFPINLETVIDRVEPRE